MNSFYRKLAQRELDQLRRWYFLVEVIKGKKEKKNMSSSYYNPVYEGLIPDYTLFAFGMLC